MSIAVMLAEASDAARMIPWAHELAQIRECELLVVIPQREKGARSWKDVEAGGGAISDAAFSILNDLGQMPPSTTESNKVTESDDAGSVATTRPKGKAQRNESSNPKGPAETEPNAKYAEEPGPGQPDAEADFVPEFRVRLFCAPNPGWALIDEINRMHVDTLILPASTPTRKSDPVSWQDAIFRNAPCDVMYLRDDDRQKMERLNVLVVTNGDIDDQTALQLGWELASRRQGSLTAAFIEPDIDDVASLVGRRLLDRIIRASLGRQHQESVAREVVVSNHLQKGIEELNPNQYDLILIGTRSKREVRSILMGNLGSSEPDPESETGVPAVAVIRRGISFHSRIWLWIRNGIERIVPQLDRTQRVSLVERIQSSSTWNFDFVSLIFLSTLIAALGLVQNSVAVVIGGMLVAPLMTPIVGMGLGLAQSNIRLIQSALRTVMLGFATALFVGFMIGLFVGDDITAEMRARENPGFADLVIALTSGIAAAYAMGRPNLVSALPGVAIAAALVPPVATAGIGLACQEWHLAGGALLLFSTNIVAIILGTTCTFWSIGLTRTRKSENPKPSWPRWIFLGLVVLSLLLTALMTMNSQADPTQDSWTPSFLQASSSLSGEF